jgi:hypothetical protein
MPDVDLRLLERPRADAGTILLLRPLRYHPLCQAHQAGWSVHPPPHRALRLRRVELRVMLTDCNH